MPILFSDERMEKENLQFSDRQTYVDIEEISINALKHALRDRAKVSISPDEGNVLFQILDNGLQISTGLTVVLGERSSGKSYTLDAMNMLLISVSLNYLLEMMKQIKEDSTNFCEGKAIPLLKNFCNILEAWLMMYRE